MVVVDLGAAPGGWSQMVRERLGDGGRVIALDILPMQGIGGVEFIQGDFREDAVVEQLEAILDGAAVDLVLSDMAPNMSGVNVSDQARVDGSGRIGAGICRDSSEAGRHFSDQIVPGSRISTNTFEACAQTTSASASENPRLRARAALKSMRWRPAERSDA